MKAENVRHLPGPSPAKPYTSFLLRCWRLEGGKRRIKVEHIQSGEWTRVATLAEAAGWIQECCDGEGRAADGQRKEGDGA